MNRREAALDAGQEPFVASKGFLVRAPYRTSMATVGTAPSLRFEVVSSWTVRQRRQDLCKYYSRQRPATGAINPRPDGMHNYQPPEAE